MNIFEKAFTILIGVTLMGPTNYISCPGIVVLHGAVGPQEKIRVVQLVDMADEENAVVELIRSFIGLRELPR